MAAVRRITVGTVKILAGIVGGIIILIIGVIIGVSGNSSPQAAKTITKIVPGPTVTKTVPGPTVTVIKRVKPPKPAGPGSTMSGDGVFVVGTDIAPGTWHTSGASGGSGGDCYVALLSSTNTSDIIDNANVTGPDTITVNSGVKAVQTSGCNTWHKL